MYVCMSPRHDSSSYCGACKGAHMHVCMHVCMYVCMNPRKNYCGAGSSGAQMYACMSIYTYIYIYIYIYMNPHNDAYG